jgi:amphi-Trp domain-containing protein
MTLSHDAPEPAAAQSMPPVQFSDLPSETAVAQEAAAREGEKDSSSRLESESISRASKDVQPDKKAQKAEKKAEKKAAKAVEKAQKAERKAIKAAKKATRKAEKKATRAVEKAARRANEKTAIVESRKASKAGEADRPREEATGKLSFDGKMDRDELAAYVEALVEGIRKGSIQFRQRNESLALSPAERIAVEVTAHRKAAREKLSLEIEWRTDEPEELTIVAG